MPSDLKIVPQQDITDYLPDALDRSIIIATQAGLPIDAHPYRVVAQLVNSTEQEVIRRVQRLLDMGIIRRIGAVPNHYRLGYRANGMSVWDVPDNLVKELGRQVGALSFVSHCYHRPRHAPTWPYNLFAMVHARTRDEAMSLVQHIAESLGEHNRGHDVLFSNRILKKTGLRIKD